VIKTFLNPEGHQNRISGSKVTAILLKGGFAYWWSFSGGGFAINGATPSSLEIYPHIFGVLGLRVAI
jgi:hypothetical protein